MPVGMMSAEHSEIGLPSRSTRAAWMLALVMPPEVSRNFIVTPFPTEAKGTDGHRHRHVCAGRAT